MMNTLILAMILTVNMAVAEADERNPTCQLAGKRYSLGAIVDENHQTYQCISIFLGDKTKRPITGWARIDAELGNIVP